jgi:hypothetical protein
MRAYAQERLSWLVKAEKLKDWLKQPTQGRRRLNEEKSQTAIRKD